MEDITARMNTYRECARHLWNTYFWREAEPRGDWDLRDAFEDVSVALFRALVLRQVGCDAVDPGPAYLVPREPLAALRLEIDPETDIMINRGADTGYWDHPLGRVAKGELDLRFIHYFDWWDLGFREFALYRARIVGSPRHPELVGRDVLVPVSGAVKVVHDPIA